MEKKKSIMRAKPLGMQVDECEKLVARCRARREQAEQGAVLAQLALSEAETELTSAESELRVLQAELARREAPKHKPDSMEGLASSLGQVISDMKNGGMVPGDLIGQAEAQMQTLMV